MTAKRIVTFTISRNPRVTTKANTQTALRKASGHLQQGDLEAARQIALEIVQTEPRNFDALHMLGVIAGRNQQQSEAIALIGKALELKPDAQAYCNRAAARLALQHHAKALADCDHAIALKAELAVAHCLRGHALAALKRDQEAFSSYDRAVALNTEYAEAWHHRGHACLNLGLIQNAIASYDRALSINPDNPGSLGNRSLCYLLTGDFQRGWTHFGARWSAKPKGSTPTPDSDAVLWTPDNFGKPVWDGKPVKGTLLIWPEQGIGDQILFASLLPQLRPLAGKVILALEERLHALYARSFPWCEITTLKAAREAGQYDVQIPVGDLGALFRHSVTDFVQHRNSYLKADPARSARLRETIAPAAGERICGISWLSVHPEFGKDKSMRLTELRPLLGTPGWRFVDLQYGDTAAERAALKAETGIDIVHIDQLDMIKDIDGLAALIDACDAVVTISNSNAHIAGALGKDVRLMLPLNAARFWYWQADRKDSLWYSRMQLLRQQNAADWGPVIKQVRDSLPAAAPATAPAASSEAFNEGNALFHSGKHAEALQAYDRALAIKPDHIKALNNRGQVLEALGKHRAALKSYEQALAIQPEFAAALTNISLCHLFLGHFEKGWKTYDARWQKWAEEFVPTPKKTALLTPSGFDKPLWDGRKTTAGVLVWHEQGIGDCILMASMVADVRKLAQNIILAVDPRLLELFKRSFPDCTIKTLQQARSEGGFDFQIPFGSLGRLFRNRLADFPEKPAAYLKADSGRSAALRKTLARPGQLLCGLSWSSSRSSLAQEKSMALSDLQPLLGMAGLRFVDLQYGDTAAERAALQTGAGIVHIDDIDILRDTEGLAALIDACDVIVTVSNTTAHIAGALGKLVWLMLPQNLGSFWYWQTDRDDTLWYPHVHVLRQQSAGDWEPVIEKVCAALPAARSPVAKPAKKKAAAARKSAVKKAPAAAKKPPPENRPLQPGKRRLPPNNSGVCCERARRGKQSGYGRTPRQIPGGVDIVHRAARPPALQRINDVMRRLHRDLLAHLIDCGTDMRREQRARTIRKQLRMHDAGS